MFRSNPDLVALIVQWLHDQLASAAAANYNLGRKDEARVLLDDSAEMEPRSGAPGTATV